MLFPWQLDEWQRLLQLKEMNRLPHAVLFSGMPGIGKHHFALQSAKMLLCKHQSSNISCTCHDCQLIDHRTHPNLCWIEPQEGHAIKIDQIRTLTEFMAHSGLQGEYKIVVIRSANCMNHHASNALLKTLEEPAGQAFIILITDQIYQLSATIRSRCQQFIFKKPSENCALEWLKQKAEKEEINHLKFILRLSQGAPLLALDWLQSERITLRNHLYHMLFSLGEQTVDPIQVAATLDLDAALFLLDLMLNFLIDLMYMKINTEYKIINNDFLTAFLKLKNTFSTEKIVKLMQLAQDARSTICKGLNLNKQLMFEHLFIQWAVSA